jgi:hypothetical protein
MAVLTTRTHMIGAGICGTMKAIILPTIAIIITTTVTRPMTAMMVMTAETTAINSFATRHPAESNLNFPPSIRVSSVANF